MILFNERMEVKDGILRIVSATQATSEGIEADESILGLIANLCQAAIGSSSLSAVNGVSLSVWKDSESMASKRGSGTV